MRRLRLCPEAGRLSILALVGAARRCHLAGHILEDQVDLPLPAAPLQAAAPPQAAALPPVHLAARETTFSRHTPSIIGELFMRELQALELDTIVGLEFQSPRELSPEEIDCIAGGMSFNFSWNISWSGSVSISYSGSYNPSGASSSSSPSYMGDSGSSSGGSGSSSSGSYGSSSSSGGA